MTVYLVGAGPGDPSLITVKGADLLRRADVLVHDRLVPPDLIELVPAGCERIAAGKEPRRPTMTQDEINQLLVDKGREAGVVVRLKGGDPFVFARGGEEAAALAAAGVPFEVVPGITSAIAAPAYAGIPVTLRQQAQALTIVTGHEDPHSGRLVDWEAVSRLDGTVVVLMGAGRAASIRDRLLAGGRPGDTPAAFVHWGTWPQQVVWRGTLAELGEDPIPSPSVLVVGVAAGVDLEWFRGEGVGQ